MEGQSSVRTAARMLNDVPANFDACHVLDRVVVFSKRKKGNYTCVKDPDDPMVCRVFLFGNGRACCSFTCFCGGRSNRVNGRREGLFTNMKLRTSKRLCYFRQLKKQKLLGRKIETETGLGMAMPRT